MWRALGVVLAGCGRLGFEPQDASDAPVDSLPADVCDLAVEPDVVALYSFEAGLADDETGSHDGVVQGATSVAPGRCGTRAISFEPEGYVLVPDAASFDLATGSIELFLMTPSPAFASDQGVLGRDASGTSLEGHLRVYLARNGDLVARIQRGGASFSRCGPPPPADTWVHVGISFGGSTEQGFRMWIDHVEATKPDSTINTVPITCGGELPAGGVAGNDNALVIGGSNAEFGAEGDPAPSVTSFVQSGRIDQVRVRSSWRDFGAP